MGLMWVTKAIEDVWATLDEPWVNYSLWMALNIGLELNMNLPIRLPIDQWVGFFFLLVKGVSFPFYLIKDGPTYSMVPVTQTSNPPWKLNSGGFNSQLSIHWNQTLVVLWTEVVLSSVELLRLVNNREGHDSWRISSTYSLMNGCCRGPPKGKDTPDLWTVQTTCNEQIMRCHVGLTPHGLQHLWCAQI